MVMMIQKIQISQIGAIMIVDVMIVDVTMHRVVCRDTIGHGRIRICGVRCSLSAVRYRTVRRGIVRGGNVHRGIVRRGNARRGIYRGVDR
jgi:hypothetical protein